jgi:hypothetical protein
VRSDRPTAFRPADLLISGDDFDRDCVDVTVVSPIITNNQPEVVVGKKAEEAERRKYTKHQAACENSGFGFKAFATDVFGVVTSSSMKLLHRICSRLVREADYPAYMASAICLRRVSFSVQLGVARMFVGCRAPVE